MNIYRKPRVFISYSHNDIPLRNECINIMKKEKIIPVFDERDIQPGDKLDLTIISLIDKCDSLICIGTQHAFSSKWVQQEVEYALNRKKSYFPVLLQDMQYKDIPEWFKGKSHPYHSEVVIVNDIKDFRRIAHDTIRSQTGISLKSAIIVLFIFIFGIPLVVGGMVRNFVSRADRYIVVKQNNVEALNSMIINAFKYGTKEYGTVIRIQSPDNQDMFIYKIATTNEVIACDYFSDTFLEYRIYYEQGNEIARDTFHIFHAPDGDISLSKIREIYSSSPENILIEDRFDSVGNLISKRIKFKNDNTWRSYADIGRSIYPVIIAPYR